MDRGVVDARPLVMWRTPAGENLAHALIYRGRGRTYCGLTLHQVLNMSTFDDHICRKCRAEIAAAVARVTEEKR